jgi:hypothetical protein
LKEQFDVLTAYIVGCSPGDQARVIRTLLYERNNAKVAAKLMKNCGYSYTDFPEIAMQLKKNTLLFLVHKNKVCDFCPDLVGPNDYELQEFLFKQLAKKQLWGEYVELAGIYPNQVSNEQIQSASAKLAESQALNSGASIYLKIDHETVFVNSEETFLHAKEFLLDASVECIGFDLELRPNMAQEFGREEAEVVEVNVKKRSLAINQSSLLSIPKRRVKGTRTDHL